MSQPFIGEIRMFAGNFAPRGWAFCDGQLLPTSDPNNTALFNLIGTTYGGDGTTTFALPDLRSRRPLHTGGSTGPGLSSYTLGEKGGVEGVTLIAGQLAPHNHSPMADPNEGTEVSPANHVWASNDQVRWYTEQSPSALMGATAGPTGNPAAPHPNLPPYLAVNFIIALTGIPPARS